MRSQSRSKRMWGIAVAGLCVLWFATPADAVPLESWDNKIPNANARFKVLNEFNGAAVLDKETGLVWERSPDLAPLIWSESTFSCASKGVGGRLGWRLPSIPELASLVDYSSLGLPVPALPPGHPFMNIKPTNYWSVTTAAADTTGATHVNFNGTGPSVGATDRLFLNQYWCVRGGLNANVLGPP